MSYILWPLAFEAWQNPTFCTTHPFMPSVQYLGAVDAAAPCNWRGKEHLEITDGMVGFQIMYVRAKSNSLSGIPFARTKKIPAFRLRLPFSSNISIRPSSDGPGAYFSKSCRKGLSGHSWITGESSRSPQKIVKRRMGSHAMLFRGLSASAPDFDLILDRYSGFQPRSCLNCFKWGENQTRG